MGPTHFPDNTGAEYTQTQQEQRIGENSRESVVKTGDIRARLKSTLKYKLTCVPCCACSFEARAELLSCPSPALTSRTSCPDGLGSGSPPRGQTLRYYLIISLPQLLVPKWALSLPWAVLRVAGVNRSRWYTRTCYLMTITRCSRPHSSKCRITRWRSSPRPSGHRSTHRCVGRPASPGLSTFPQNVFEKANGTNSWCPGSGTVWVTSSRRARIVTARLVHLFAYFMLEAPRGAS